MHIGQGFILLNGSIKIAVINKVTHPININKNSDLELGSVMFGSVNNRMSYYGVSIFLVNVVHLLKVLISSKQHS